MVPRFFDSQSENCSFVRQVTSSGIKMQLLLAPRSCRGHIVLWLVYDMTFIRSLDDYARCAHVSHDLRLLSISTSLAWTSTCAAARSRMCCHQIWQGMKTSPTHKYDIIIMSVGGVRLCLFMDFRSFPRDYHGKQLAGYFVPVGKMGTHDVFCCVGYRRRIHM